MDDGYESIYNIIYPFLYKLNIKFSIAPILGHYIYKTEKRHNPHLTKEQTNKMLKSGLVELLYHTVDLHNKKGKTLFKSLKCGEGVKKINKKESKNTHTLRIVKDVHKSREIMENFIGYTANVFVYPYGAYDENSKEVIQNNFRATVGTDIGIINLANDNNNKLIDIPRIKIIDGLKIGEILNDKSYYR